MLLCSRHTQTSTLKICIDKKDASINTRTVPPHVRAIPQFLPNLLFMSQYLVFSNAALTNSSCRVFHLIVIPGICESYPTIGELDSGLTSTVCFHLPVGRNLDRTGRTPYHPQCSGHPLFVRYWETAALGTNPNLLLRTESQHTSVDSDHSSAQYMVNTATTLLNPFDTVSLLIIHRTFNGNINI